MRLPCARAGFRLARVRTNGFLPPSSRSDHGTTHPDHQQGPGGARGPCHRGRHHQEPRQPARSLFDVPSRAGAGGARGAPGRLRALRGRPRHAGARPRRDDGGARAGRGVRLGRADRQRAAPERARVDHHRDPRGPHARRPRRGRPDHRLHAAPHAGAPGGRRDRRRAPAAVRRPWPHRADGQHRLLCLARHDGERLRARGGPRRRGA